MRIRYTIDDLIGHSPQIASLSGTAKYSFAWNI